MILSKNIAKDIFYWIKEIVISPILYIALIPIMSICQAIFHNVPVELFIIDAIIAGVTSVIWIIRVIIWSV
jgi:hypothetical protein